MPFTPTPRHSDTPTRPLRRRRAGFTLIELIMVLVVMAILVGMAMPALEGTVAGQGGRDTSVQLLALTLHARSQAIAEGASYRLMLDIPNRTYYLAKLDLGQWVPLGEEVGRPHTVPEGVELGLEDVPTSVQAQQSAANGVVLPDRPPSDVPYIEFYPSGRVDPAVIVVTNQRDGSVRRLVCPSATETFRIIDQDGKVKN